MTASHTVDALVFAGPSRFDDGLPFDSPRLATNDGVFRILTPATPPDRDLRRANAQLRRFAAQVPQVRGTLVRVDPWDDDAVGQLRHGLEQGSLGAFVHPWQETVAVTDRRLDPLVAVLLEHDRPLMLEGGFPWLSEPAQLGAFAARHPQLRVVATRGLQMNMSGLAIDTALRALQANLNLACTTSGTYRQDFLQSIVDEGIGDRLLYASLSPVLDERLEILRPAGLTDDARAAVALGNATTIFRLPS